MNNVKHKKGKSIVSFSVRVNILHLSLYLERHLFNRCINDIQFMNN